MDPLTLYFSSYSFNVWALPPLLIGILVLGLGLVVLGRESFSHTSMAFFAICLSIAVWLLTTSMMYLSTRPETALVWANAIYLGVSFVPAAIYHFCTALTGSFRRRMYSVWTAWLTGAVFCVLSLSTDFIIGGVYDYWWGYYKQYSLSALVYLAYFALLLGLAMYYFWKRYRSSVPGSRSHRVSRLMLVAFSVAYLGSVDYLPGFGFAVFPFGFIPVLGFTAMGAFAIWHYRLTPLTPALAAREILTTMEEPVLAVDREGVVQVANDALCSLLGFETENVHNRPVREVLRCPKHMQHRLSELLEQQQLNDEELTLLTRDDHPLDLQFSSSRLSDESNIDRGTVLVLHDVTRQKQLQRALENRTLRDELTGLSSRPLFRERCQQVLENHQEHDEPGFSLVLLDLDGFQQINENHGYQGGDRVLRTVASRLEAGVSSRATVARGGGDEFGLLLPTDRTEDVRHRVKTIRESLTRPIPLEDETVNVSVRFGIAKPDEEVTSPDALIRNAEIALHSIKNQDHVYAQYEEEMRQEKQSLRRRINQLRQGMNQNQLEVYFQPIVEIESRTTAGMEALVRWRHPEQGLLSPGVFLPAADEGGLMPRLDRYVLEKACRKVEESLPSLDLWVSVNLSADSLRSPGTVDTIRSVLDQTGWSPDSLRLEILESSMIESSRSTRQFFDQLQEMGIHTSLDDFGTGYSTLQYLRQLPVEVLKVYLSLFYGLSKREYV